MILFYFYFNLLHLLINKDTLRTSIFSFHQFSVCNTSTIVYQSYLIYRSYVNISFIIVKIPIEIFILIT